MPSQLVRLYQGERTDQQRNPSNKTRYQHWNPSNQDQIKQWNPSNQDQTNSRTPLIRPYQTVEPL